MPVMKVGPGRALLYSGVVPWSPALPTTDGGLLPEHWYRSDGPLWQDAGITPAVLDGAMVGRWEDITANADHVNQAGVAPRPTLQNGAGDLLNGCPVVRFDGIEDYLMGAFTTGGALAQPFTVFAVAALDAAAVNDDVSRKIYDSDDAVNRMIAGQYGGSIPNRWYVYAGAVLGPTAAASNSNWNLWTSLYNGATSQLWHNGVSLAGPGNAGAHNADGLTIGGAFDVTAQWDGDITEIIIYDADLSTADDNQVGNYLATRYGLAYTDI